VHEFEADDLTIKRLALSKISYAEELIESAKQYQSPQISNQYYSLIKNRIKMLKNSSNTKLSYLFMLPILAIVFCSFTFKKYPILKSKPVRLESVVDSVPKLVVDTIVYYDYNSKKEVMTIVNKTEEVNQNLIKTDVFENVKFSGKYTAKVDTVTFYNYDTKESKMGVHQYEIPIEIAAKSENMEITIYDALKEKYAINMKKIEIVEPKEIEHEMTEKEFQVEKKPYFVFFAEGMKIENPQGIKLGDILPNYIESVNVIQDKSALEKYGDKGKNGVIEITFKDIKLLPKPWQDYFEKEGRR
jgi:bla regulator protein blaR1